MQQFLSGRAVLSLAQASPADGDGDTPLDGVSPTDAPDVVLDALRSLWEEFLSSIPMLIVALALLIATWLIARIVTALVRRSMARTRLRISLKELIRQLVYISIWVVGIVVTLITTTGLDFGQVIATLGLGSIALGFAFKDIFENFFAGMLILWRFPFDPGDFIECNGICGKVEEITIRMTLIRQVDGQLVTVPNATLFKDPVYVLTSLPRRRATIIAGVAYGEDVDESREVIRRAVEKCPTVDESKPIEIFAQEFASSSINFEVAWWTGNTPLDIRRSRDEVVAAVKRALDEAGIEIPFPYRTLTFKHALPIEQAGGGPDH